MPVIDDIVADRKAVWDNPPRRKRIGLALGGGAARGIAHIGALQVLEDNEIYPHIITGTSVGAWSVVSMPQACRPHAWRPSYKTLTGLTWFRSAAGRQPQRTWRVRSRWGWWI